VYTFNGSQLVRADSILITELQVHGARPPRSPRSLRELFRLLTQNDQAEA
jgi:hypothetical protein